MLPPATSAYVASPVPGDGLVPLIVPARLRTANAMPTQIVIAVSDVKLPGGGPIRFYLVPDGTVTLSERDSYLGSVGSVDGAERALQAFLTPEPGAMRAMLASRHPRIRIVVGYDMSGGTQATARTARIISAY